MNKLLNNFACLSILILLVTSSVGCGGSSDTVAPALESATQNRDADPQGSTVDFAFSEPLLGSTATELANYISSGGQTARFASLVGDQEIVRVTFDAAVLPGTDTFSVSGIRDQHENEMAAASDVALATTDTTPPGVSSSSAQTVVNAWNDIVAIEFNDLMIAEDVETAANYLFEHPTGTPVSLAGAAFSYDSEAGILVIQFSGSGGSEVNLQTGATWRLYMSGLRDLGANSIAASASSIGTVTGDVTTPGVMGATQNATASPDGRAVDISFGEVIDPTSASNPANYAASGGQTTLWAGVLWPGDMVRVVFDAAVVPGTDTLLVQNVTDLAGNAMAALPVQAVSAPDAVAPTVSLSTGTAISGYRNDTLIVTFDEPVLPLEAGNLANYALETPTGIPASLAGSSIDFDEQSSTATITLSGTGASALDFTTGQSFQLTASGIRDVAGNVIGAGGVFSGLVAGDSAAPSVISVTQAATFDPYGRTVDVLFDEPVALSGSPSALFSADGGQTFVHAEALEGSMIVRVAFSDVIVPGTTSVSVDDVEDPAGNSGGLISPLSVSSPDVVAPEASGSAAVTVAGPANDEVTWTFDEQVIRADAESSANWALESPTGFPVSLAGASFSYDAQSRVVTIGLPSGTNLTTGNTFTLLASSVRDVAGNAMGLSVPFGGTVTGDSTLPTVVVADRNEVADPGDRTMDVTFSEALDLATAENSVNYTVVGVGAPLVQSATMLLDGLTVRLYLTAAVTPGTHTLDISGVKDLAGNTMTVATGVTITL